MRFRQNCEKMNFQINKSVDLRHNKVVVETIMNESLSAAAEGMIHLTPRDILDQFVVPSDTLFTQGGTLLDGKLYHTYGCPKHGYPLELLVFDLKKKSLIIQMTEMDQAFGGEEIECCAEYQGKLLCNTCDGSIFAVGEQVLPVKDDL